MKEARGKHAATDHRILTKLFVVAEEIGNVELSVKTLENQMDQRDMPISFNNGGADNVGCGLCMIEHRCVAVSVSGSEAVSREGCRGNTVVAP